MTTDITNQQHNILKGYNMLLYFAGTMIMYEPSEECIIDFWKNGFLKKLPVSSSNPVFMKAASQLRESCTDESSSTNSMIEDYYRLFTREEHPLAPVYESFYRKSSHDTKVCNVSDVTEFYRSYGWMPKFRPEKKDDHLGIELLFLTILIDKYMILDDEACRREMRNEIRRFIEEHIFSWITEWYKRVQEYSVTLSYKGISSLIYGCVEDIHSVLSDSNELFTQRGYLRN
jgi:putative dimethyl sulfoxide reductase chaperone